MRKREKRMERRRYEVGREGWREEGEKEGGGKEGEKEGGCRDIYPCSLQARVTDDYQPGNDNWKVGVSNLFAHALGVAPYKDTFWTTPEQPGNPYS